MKQFNSSSIDPSCMSLVYVSEKMDGVCKDSYLFKGIEAFENMNLSFGKLIMVYPIEILYRVSNRIQFYRQSEKGHFTIGDIIERIEKFYQEGFTTAHYRHFAREICNHEVHDLKSFLLMLISYNNWRIRHKRTSEWRQH